MRDYSTMRTKMEKKKRCTEGAGRTVSLYLQLLLQMNLRNQQKGIRIMKNHGNLTPAKAQNKAPVTGPKEMEIYE